MVALLSAKNFSRGSIRVRGSGCRAIFSPKRLENQWRYSEDFYFQLNEEQRISSVDIVKQSIFTDEFNSLGENHLWHGKNHRGRCRAGVIRD